MTRDKAIKATRNGGIAASFWGVIVLGAVLFNFFGGASETLNYRQDAWLWADAIFLLACAYAMSRQSRVAAILAFVNVAALAWYGAIENPQRGGLLINLILLYFIGRGIQGALVFHRLERAENPNYRRSARWQAMAGIPLILGFACFIGLGMLRASAATPSAKILSTTEIRVDDLATLREEGILAAQEQPHLVYFPGLLSVLDGGALLTSERVITYEMDSAGELAVRTLDYADIKSVELLETGSWISDSRYRVSGSKPGDELILRLSTADQRDQHFVDLLSEWVQSARQNNAAESSNEHGRGGERWSQAMGRP